MTVPTRPTPAALPWMLILSCSRCARTTQSVEGGGRLRERHSLSYPRLYRLTSQQPPVTFLKVVWKWELGRSCGQMAAAW